MVEGEPCSGRDHHPGVVAAAVEPPTTEIERQPLRPGLHRESATADAATGLEQAQAQIGTERAQVSARGQPGGACAYDRDIDIGCSVGPRDRHACSVKNRP